MAEMILNNEHDIELVRQAQRSLINATLDHSNATKIALISNDAERLEDGTPIVKLPPTVLRFVADMLGELAQGKAITLVPHNTYITTQEAANMLNMSRPFLIKLLEAGDIPFIKTGLHRRILFNDVVKYREKRKQEQEEALQLLIDKSQEMGGY